MKRNNENLCSVFTQIYAGRPISVIDFGRNVRVSGVIDKIISFRLGTGRLNDKTKIVARINRPTGGLKAHVEFNPDSVWFDSGPQQ